MRPWLLVWIPGVTKMVEKLEVHRRAMTCQCPWWAGESESISLKEKVFTKRKNNCLDIEFGNEGHYLEIYRAQRMHSLPWKELEGSKGLRQEPQGRKITQGWGCTVRNRSSRNGRERRRVIGKLCWEQAAHGCTEITKKCPPLISPSIYFIHFQILNFKNENT